jgi:hypothetical protein
VLALGICKRVGADLDQLHLREERASQNQAEKNRKDKKARRATAD